MSNVFPVAMSAPSDDVTVLTQSQIDEAITMSRQSPRKRIILPYHKGDASTLHRMFNVAQPGTFIRPHWHRHPPKDEALILLQGALTMVLFSDQGEVEKMIPLKAGTTKFGIDLVAGVCHSFIVSEPDTVVYEVKPGPYNPQTDKDFALWAPEEGTDAAQAYLANLSQAAGIQQAK